MAQSAPTSQDLVLRGAYLARAGDCGGCHIARDKQPFVGGMPFVISVGTVYSTNITPDSETGIGRYGINDFVKVMRLGVAKDGHHLYPAMPYPSYAVVTKQDIMALYAFFMQGVRPVRNLNHAAKLNFPLGLRSLMSLWNDFYLTKGEYAADPSQSASWNRGAYLVQGLGHCGDCHTPRGIAGQVKAGSEKDGSQFLAGATLENWHAPSLRGDFETGLLAWTQDDIVVYLKTGRTARVAATKMMTGVIEKSTQFLTDDDLRAIAEYLKTLPPHVYKSKTMANTSLHARSDSTATRALRTGAFGIRGARVYLDNCNSCHGSDGAGARETFPNLVKNETVEAHDPASLIHIVLSGSSMPSTQAAPSAPAMPDFGWRLTDADVADVLSFVRGGWGNNAPAVTGREVGRVRKALAVQMRQKQ
jgi:mono/diheme cytochrome c family protein